MRSSRSGSARGLRSAGSPPEPSASRFAQSKTKRRPRSLPLSNNRNNNDDREEKEQLEKIDSNVSAEFESSRSRGDDDTSVIKDASTPPASRSLENQENSDDRLLALCGGSPVFVNATVLGKIVRRQLDVTKGLGQDGNQFFCEICKEFGNVVCCDGCPKVYHAACIDSSDPARKALENDDDPWFCSSCRSLGNTTRLSSTPGIARPHRNMRSTNMALRPDKSLSRPERRSNKRKCSECQHAGGDMIPCATCGVNYIHNPSCREDEDSIDDMHQMCSDCRAEAIVNQDEEDDGADLEMEEDYIVSRKPIPERAKERRRGIHSESKDPKDMFSSEEASNEIEENDDGDEDEEDEEESKSIDIEREKSFMKKKRKRSNSDHSEKKKKTKVSSELKLRKKIEKKDKKKLRMQVDAEKLGDSPIKMEASPRRSLSRKGLVQPTPAFFFFLNDSKFKIERALARKHKYFNRLPKGQERNDLIAREGARWWVKLRPIEQRRYFTMSMRDFEEKVVEWKEEKTIREMIAARDPGDRHFDPDFDVDDESQDLSPEDEMMAYAKHERLFLSTSVGSKPFAPESGKSNNRILLELLQDMRFHPSPVFNPLRNGESGLLDRSKTSIPYFEVQGPISTSVGDECSGCTRGWNHFCHVLKRRIPAVENRARLQPPMSSLMATRVGLGLKSKIPDLDDDKGSESELFEIRLSEHAREALCVPAIPSFTLTNPSERADDVVCFVEECLAMKVSEPSRPSAPDSYKDPQKKTMLSRGLLPMRGRRKGEDALDGLIPSEGIDSSKSALYKCGRCRTIIDNDTGCIQCRRAQLVINTSKRASTTALSSPGKEKRLKETLKVQTTMIGRLTVKETNFEDQAMSDRSVANALLKIRWMPSAILPSCCTVAPRPKPKSMERQPAGQDTGTSDPQGDNVESGSVVTEDSDQRTSTPNEGQDPSPHPSNETHAEGADDAEDGARPGRLRPRRMPLLSSDPSESHVEHLETDRTIDRQQLAEDHKHEATNLAKKCLSVACCGIFQAIVRRDPLCLFAEPVPSNVVGYSQVVTSPIDISLIKSRILDEKYTSLSAFVADVRLLCTNALAFNAQGSIYAKTAKELYDAVEIMNKRATKWMIAIKEAHASSFAWKGSDAKGENEDPFHDLRISWPEAVEMLESKDRLFQQVSSDFTRTKENETAYYGSIAIRRAAAAAEASLVSYPDSGGIHSAIVRRSHDEDENLRRYIDYKVSQLTGPVQLADVPRWREESILRTLRRVQSRRLEGRIMSENGSARCDGIRTDSKLALNAIRWGRNKRKGEIETLPRVDESRLSLTTGLASKMAYDRIGRDFDGSEVVEMPNKCDVDDDEADSDDERSNGPSNYDKAEMELIEADDAIDEWDKKLGVAVTVRGSRVHGWGLFADQPFKKGDVVAEYVGEYISNAVADSREKMYQERRIQDYQFRVDENLVIDATLNGGHGRYINHNCNPNCIAKIVDGPPPNKHLKRVMIIAQRDIKAREEITYDYQFPLELDLDARIPCNCGSLLCRGFMNWDLPEKGSKNRVLRPQKRGGNMRDRIRRLGRPLKKHDEK